MSKEFDMFLENCPEAGKAYMELFKSVLKAPALDKKTKQLILIAVMAAQNYRPGVEAHVPQAVKAGATREEIVEAVLLTLPVAGINGLLESLPVIIDGTKT
jgi:AhpD family alkylhydroperoxidase